MHKNATNASYNIQYNNIANAGIYIPYLQPNQVLLVPQPFLLLPSVQLFPGLQDCHFDPVVRFDYTKHQGSMQIIIIIAQNQCDISHNAIIVSTVMSCDSLVSHRFLFVREYHPFLGFLWLPCALGLPSSLCFPKKQKCEITPACDLVNVASI